MKNQDLKNIQAKDDEQEQIKKKIKLNNSNEEPAQVKNLAPNDKDSDKKARDLSKIINPFIEQKNLKGLIECLKDNKSYYKEYNRLKFKNIIYKISDTVLISNEEDQAGDFIGRINKIIRIDSDRILTLIQVNWFYRKSDFPDKFNNIKDIFSDNELFETNHTDVTFVDCINGLCKIISFEEYDSLSQIPINTYYTRATYDVIKKKLNPPIDKWNKSCICQKPMNPDLLFIQCDICKIWFHIECVNLTEEQVNKIDQYSCHKCSQTGLQSNEKQ